jgi:hypothetical protein
MAPDLASKLRDNEEREAFLALENLARSLITQRRQLAERHLQENSGRLHFNEDGDEDFFGREVYPAR